MALSRARLLRAAGRILLYGLMLLAVFALWKPNATPFIYVAF
jgi:hypothetical protein